jgi:peptidoglycan/LPS O-acetylase OafA/YrhL
MLIFACVIADNGLKSTSPRYSEEPSLLNHREHLSSLDGIRGVAVLMVFCHHLCPFAATNPIAVLCSTLWLGVDLFFVLSGFLITGVLYDTIHEQGYFRKFYARRGLRLAPVYLAVVAGILIASSILGDQLTVWTLPYFVYASNIIRELHLPDGLAVNLDASHFWSLAVEEQFYLLWPLAMFLARTRTRILGLCLAGCVISVVLRFIATAHVGHFFLGTPYFQLPMRLDSLLLGGALAMIMRSEGLKSKLTSLRLHIVFAVGMVTLAASFGIARHGSMFSPSVVRYGYFAAALTFAALIGISVQSSSWANRVGRISWLRMFGRCSYGLYLIHLIPRHWYFVVLQSAKAHCANSLQWGIVATGIFFAYLALCFGIAMLSYLTLERYFLRMKINFRYTDEKKFPASNVPLLASPMLSVQ